MRGSAFPFNGRWFVIALSILTLSVLAGVYETYFVMTKIYYATSEIEVLAPKDEAGAHGFSPLRDVEIMKTTLFLAPIISDLGLDHIWAKRVYHSELLQLPMQDAASYLKRLTFFEVVPGTQMIRITVASEVPKEASDIANAIADRFSVVHPDDRQAKDPARIISRAEPPEFPTGPDHGRNIAIAAAIGIPISITIATVLEIFLRAVSRHMPVAPVQRDPRDSESPSLQY